MLIIRAEDTALRDYLQKLQERLNELTPVMAGIGAELESRISARFETQTDPGGNSWSGWAPSTLRSYPFPGSKAAAQAGKPGHGRVLDRYGDMLAGLSHQADASSVQVGFDRAYATFHEFGTHKMPRRNLLFDNPYSSTLAPNDAQAVREILSEFLMPA